MIRTGLLLVIYQIMKKRYYGGSQHEHVVESWKIINWLELLLANMRHNVHFIKYTQRNHTPGTNSSIIFLFFVREREKKFVLFAEKCEKHSVNPTTTDRINRKYIFQRFERDQWVWSVIVLGNARILGNSSLFRFQYDIFHFI